MTNKERVHKTLGQELTDRVPFFYWGVPEFTEKMMSHLGFSSRDQLLDFLDVDFRWIEPNYIGPSLSVSEKKKRDIWGVEYTLVGTGNKKSWKVSKSPLQGITDSSVLADYNWPTVDLFDFSVLDEQIKKYSNYAIMTAPGYSSPGLFRIIQRLVGYDDYLDVMVYHSKFFNALVDYVSEFYVNFIESFFEVAGDRVDFIRLSDNFGSKDGLIVTNETWQEIVKPVYERYLEIPQKLKVKVYMHSCGGVRKLLPEFISIGADVLDPIQTRAAGMSPEGLKKDFGRLISFSGGIDEEELLRKGTPEMVKKGVHDLLEIMAPEGGFILGPSDKFVLETPIDNVLAMYEAAKEWKNKR